MKELFALNMRAVKLVSRIVGKSFFVSRLLNTLFVAASPYVTIYMSAEILTELAGNADRRRLIFLVALTLGLRFGINIIRAVIQHWMSKKSYDHSFAVRCLYNENDFALDYEHLENKEVLDRRQKLLESSNINNFGIGAVTDNLTNLFECAINIVLSLALLPELFVMFARRNEGLYGAVAFPVALVLLIAVTAFVSIIRAVKESALGQEVSNSMMETNRFFMTFSGDAYKFGRDLRIFNMLPMLKRQRERDLENHKTAFKKYQFKMFFLNIPTVVISQVTNFVIYAFVCLNAVRGMIDVGGVVKYVGIITKFIAAINQISSILSMFKMNQPYLQEFMDFFEIKNTMYKGTLPVEKRSDREYELEFRDVSFKYPGSDEYALKNLSMKFTIGSRLAVVGMNGSGKTTMIKLLCRLYDATEGVITLNGIDIRKYDYEEYMRVFSVVFQDFKLFPFTLGQNVAASTDMDANRVRRCLELVGFGERYAHLPHGLETHLYKEFEPEGVEISGGEAQKIALARALYKDAPVIVLDEPTAALDPFAEYEIYSKFNDIIEDKTAIYISHRLSSCRFCADIAVFHEGRMVQRGSHDELLADEGGKYHELWYSQAQHYTEEADGDAAQSRM